MEKQLIVMLQLQDKMNQKVHPDWKNQNFEWYRAIWIECAELMDHYGWKWWKKQDPDADQVNLELVDIWHFGLAQLLESGDTLEVIAQKIKNELDLSVTVENFRSSVEVFSESVLRTKAFDVKSFAAMMVGMDMSFEGLYQSYIGKNVLNFFRQDNGYQDGSYHKVWEGKEDNEHLVEILQSLNSSSPSFQQDVYRGLEAKYPA